MEVHAAGLALEKKKRLSLSNKVKFMHCLCICVDCGNILLVEGKNI